MRMTARPIMVQGTMSNAGKSLLVAGLCRVFSQDGHRCVPFKSQNMALNSAVTPDGLEMGRAQALQAQAAGVEPSVDMNPILLKPEGEQGSQVIVRGRAVGALSAREYFARKRSLAPVVRASYERLAAEADVVVIEGAGSPAEINLKADDIVNMGMARMAGAPVLLVGDIDPGGVFAQLYGTVALLDAEDRARVKGLVVNKFRGDASILRPGLAPLEDLCGAPVVGVVPYRRFDLDDEDSLSDRLTARTPSAVLDVAVVRLPHLSNFTDFSPLSRHPSMGVRYVERAVDLGRPDLVVLPGTKSAVADARWLASCGLAACVRALAQEGTPVLGVCGGFQLLGEELDDPVGSEGGGTACGLGLLPVRTVFEREKRLARAVGTVRAAEGVFACWHGLDVSGYEIHAGRTDGACPPALTLARDDGARDDGAVRGNVLGTYLHGVFDAPRTVETLADALLARRGLPSAGVRLASTAQERERQLDELAGLLRASIDLEAVYRILEEGA